MYIQRIILKLAKEGFQIRPVQPRYVKLHNCGTLGLGTSRNVSGISNASLQQHCNGTFFSVMLFVFSAIKGPAKELRLSLFFVKKIPLSRHVGYVMDGSMGQ